MVSALPGRARVAEVLDAGPLTARASERPTVVGTSPCRILDAAQALVAAGLPAWG